MSPSNQFSIPRDSEDKVILVTDFQINLVLLKQADELILKQEWDESQKTLQRK